MNSESLEDRYAGLRKLAERLGVDAVALVPGANFARLYGKQFHQSERPLVVVIPRVGAPAAIVPSLELSSFELVGFEGKVFDWRDQDGYQSAFSGLLTELSVNTIAVEGQVMRVFVANALTAAAPALKLQDAQKEISSLRLLKTPDELQALRTAIEISERALEGTIAQVAVGQSEQDIESLLKQQLFACGAEGFSFDPIVAAAENSARPHASARADYKLKSGDALLIDFGARYHGMCADITRTFFVGQVNEDSEAVYQTVLDANLAGIQAVKPGASAHDVDDAATSVLEASAYSDRICHKTGHGLGRDVHEDPYIMRGNSQVLEAGMVFTVEPGLYDEQTFGIRIEDNVVVGEEGVLVLTTYPKELTIIG